MMIDKIDPLLLFQIIAVLG